MKFVNRFSGILLLAFTATCFSRCDNKKTISWDLIQKAQGYAKFGIVRYENDRASDSFMIRFEMETDTPIKHWLNSEDIKTLSPFLRASYLDNAVYVKNEILGIEATKFNYIRFFVTSIMNL